MRLKISARKSDLARLQAYMVGEALCQKFPELEIEYRFKESLGDKNLTDPLWKIPEKGVFTEDFNQELISGDTDMVVHSWKDLPTEIKDYSEIAATLPRADQRDLLLVKKNHFAVIQKTHKLRVFSSSPRRSYNLTPFLREAFPWNLSDVEFSSVRGNIPTRVRKLLESADTDGLIVAKAAFDRLLSAPHAEFKEMQQQLRDSLVQLDWMVLPLSVNPNAAAQGALAVEILKKRSDLKKYLTAINDKDTHFAASEERRVLASFGGGCHQKIGVTTIQKKYGVVQILKGLTTAGKTLDQHEILNAPRAHYQANESFSSDQVSLLKARPLLGVTIPSEVNALYVAKAEAWCESWSSQNKIIWTSGVQTWKKLAQKGIWVHGCSDGMGENEETQVDVLVNHRLKWAKASHREGVADQTKQLIATYELIASEVQIDLHDKKSFFWTSSSSFKEALRRFPQILSAQHACGPGHTYQIIAQELSQAGFDPQTQLRIYLNSHEWRQKCIQT